MRTPSGISPIATSPEPRITLDMLRDRIARRAYELYQERGATDGRDLDDWLRAEEELTASMMSAV